MPFEDFTKLAQSVVQQCCAVVIGAGVSAPLLPLAGQLAKELEQGLPLDHPSRSDGLASVAQALSTLNHPLFVKRQLQVRLKQRLKDLTYESEVWRTYRLIAALPVKVFITTNYDTLLFDAIAESQKEPQLMIAPWMDFSDDAGIPTKMSRVPSVASPLVLHLHGHIDHPETLVLTEDDYIQFLFAIAQDIDKAPKQKRATLLPMVVRKGLSSQNLLMLGYRAADINFRLLVKSAEALLEAPRHVSGSSGRVRVSVQLRPEHSNNEAGVMKYLEGLYEHSLSFKLFWGSAYDFLTVLRPAIAEAQDALRPQPEPVSSTTAEF